MKKLAKILALLFAIVIIATGCKKLPEFTDGSGSTPNPVTPTPTGTLYYHLNEEPLIGSDFISISAKYSSQNDITEMALQVSEDITMNTEVFINTIDFSFPELSGTVNGLQPNTHYYWCISYYETGLHFLTDPVEFTTLEGGGGEAPTVTTSAATVVTSNSAILNGIITNYDSSLTYYCLFEWGISENLDNVIASESINNGSFSVNLTGLSENTTYYFKASANNTNGTGNGVIMSFTTLESGGSGDVPTGAINGLFSVSDTKQVYFSQGNLQYQASTNTWKFAEHQYDYVGFGEYAGNVYENGIKCDNNMISSSYSGWIDLFGWGTSGYNHGAVCYQPWSTSENNNDYLAYGYSMFNLYSESGQADWGYNPISNGGNTENQWRCLTKEQTVYLFNERNTASGYRYARAVVTILEGIILLPDDWDSSIYSLNNVNLPDSNPDDNTISEDIWNSVFEANGAVFLPPTGHRTNTTTSDRYVGSYWTSSNFSSIHDNLAYGINNGTALLIGTGGGCCRGNAVRLVQDAN